MRVAIIVDDNRVFVNGCAEMVDCSALVSQDIHAVQWYGSWGEVEYATDLQSGHRRPNERIVDFSPFLPYQNVWETEARKPLAGLTTGAKPAPTIPAASS